MDTYPAAEKSYRGLFLAGVSYYRSGDYAKALTVFQRALVLAGGPEEQSAVTFGRAKSTRPRMTRLPPARPGRKPLRLTPPGIIANAPMICCRTGRPSPATSRSTWVTTSRWSERERRNG